MIKLKKAQGAIEMSFGTIFSILLIIFFVAIAFIVIRYFLNIQDCAKVGMFLDELQTEIDKTWNSQSNTISFKGSLPTGIEYICFADLSKPLKGEYEGDISMNIGVYKGQKANLFFYPREKSCKIAYKNIAHLDTQDIIKDKNPNCIKTDNSEINFKIKKGFNEKLVTISNE